MVIANPPLAEPVIDPGGVTIKPPFEMGVANLVLYRTYSVKVRILIKGSPKTGDTVMAGRVNTLS